MADSRIDSNRVWVTVTTSVTTGPYESGKIEVGYSRNYSEDDDPLEMIEEMSDDLEALVVSRVNILKKKIVKRKRRDNDE